MTDIISAHIHYVAPNCCFIRAHCGLRPESNALLNVSLNFSNSVNSTHRWQEFFLYWCSFARDVDRNCVCVFSSLLQPTFYLQVRITTACQHATENYVTKWLTHVKMTPYLSDHFRHPTDPIDPGPPNTLAFCNHGVARGCGCCSMGRWGTLLLQPRELHVRQGISFNFAPFECNTHPFHPVLAIPVAKVREWWPLMVSQNGNQWKPRVKGSHILRLQWVWGAPDQARLPSSKDARKASRAIPLLGLQSSQLGQLPFADGDKLKLLLENGNNDGIGLQF